MLQNGFRVEAIKTNVIEVDDSSHALPPHLGVYQEYNVSEFFCPDEWSKDGVFIPVKEGDALWFDLRQNDDCAVLPSIQRVNPVTGEPSNLEGGLSKDPVQNYMVLPQQQWIDGYAKNGKVYQFRITKAGEGLAVNEFILPKNMQDSHAVGFAFYGLKNPKPKFSNSYKTNYYEMVASQKIGMNMWQKGSRLGSQPSTNPLGCSVLRSSTLFSASATNMCSDSSIILDNSINCFSDSISMDKAVIEDRLEDNITFDKASMGAGGRIAQAIISDNNSVDYYKEKPDALLIMYFCLPEQFEIIMKKGRRNNNEKKDKFVFSGEIGGVQVPLIK